MRYGWFLYVGMKNVAAVIGFTGAQNRRYSFELAFDPRGGHRVTFCSYLELKANIFRE